MSKNTIILAFFTLLVSLLSQQAFSQGRTWIHVGVSIPTYDFGADDIEDEEAGGAGVGPNVRLEYVFPIAETGLGIFTGIALNYNPLQRSYRRDLREAIGGKHETFPKYINIPLSTGLSYYTFSSKDKVGVVLNAGIVVNFLKTTDWVIEYRGVEIRSVFDEGVGFGAKLGVALLLSEKLSLGLDYLWLGEYSLNDFALIPSVSKRKYPTGCESASHQAVHRWSARIQTDSLQL